MRPRLALALVVVLAALVRAPFWVEALRTPVDGDTAIIGLMARHPASSFTMWGQPYGSPVEAFLALPFMAALGPTATALRLLYFVLGLGLVPAAYLLGRALHRDAALPAALLAACPPPYLLLLAALPPPMYPAALLLGASLLVLALGIVPGVAAGEASRTRLAVFGLLAGLALWTHLMTASVVAATCVYLARRAGGGRRMAFVFVPLALARAPRWALAIADRHGTAAVSVSSRQQTMGEHLREVLPGLHRPVGGLLGTHVPVIADDPVHRVAPPPWVGVLVVVLNAGGVLVAARASRGRGAAGVLLAAIALTLAAFPFPLRSSVHSIRFLTPAWLPLAALVAWAPVALGRRRLAWALALALASLHLLGGARLLDAWRLADRAAEPFLLPDLAPARRVLEAHGVHRAYASYGPAYRLTFESGERVVATQPWNERFRHYPLPYLDEVRFSKNVAWVLTPSVPTDLPAPRAFETALGAIGGGWRRSDAGASAVYHAFAPPFSPYVAPLAAAGAAGDGDPATAASPDPAAPATFEVEPPADLDAVTLVAAGEVRLPRSMDVEVSADGVTFETVARRRRREERSDLRWVNGHPQYVIDHDLLAVPLGGRRVGAVRVTPVASTDPWTLAEVLLHPAEPARRPWDEWLDPNLTWPQRRDALVRAPRRDREDWHYRMLLADRRR